MAITNPIIPSVTSPSGNPLIFKFTSSNFSITYFQMDIRNDSQIFSSLKIYPTPKERASGTIDISKIVANYCYTQIFTTNSIFYGVDVREYYLVVTEYSRSGASLVAGSTYTTGKMYSWNGAVAPIGFKGYNYNQYSSTIGTSRFLSNKPLISTINFWSTEYLYFLNAGEASYAVYRWYYNDGSTGSNAFSMDTSSKAGRINISPRAILNQGINVSNLKYFTVELINVNYVPKSELITRVLEYDGCAKPVNIHWLNSLGGVDSTTVFNVRETRNVTKVTLDTGAEDIYKSFEHVIDVKETSTYTVNSEFLNDKSYSWITELISSRAAFVELSNGYLLPIKINNTSAPIQTSRFSNTPNSFEFQFIAPSGLNIPYSETSSTKIGMIGTNDVIVLPAPNEMYTINNHGLLI